MNKIFKSTIIIFSITILSCKKKQTQIIYNDIFNNLIENAMVDYRNLEIPSPNDTSNKKALDSLISLTLKKNNLYHSEQLILAVKDSLFSITDINKTLRSFKDININPSIYKDFKSERIEKIKVEVLPIDSKRFIVISHTDQTEFVQNELLINVTLSKIYTHENIGFFSVSFSRGSLNAYGVNVLIRKNKENWEILKIVDSWES